MTQPRQHLSSDARCPLRRIALHQNVAVRLGRKRGTHRVQGQADTAKAAPEPTIEVKKPHVQTGRCMNPDPCDLSL